MRGRSIGWGVPVLAMVLALMAGCGVNSTFVYKPGAPAAGGPKLPLKVAVLPFKDGTEDFTDRGSVFSSGHYNLAKAGVAATMTALTPELWAKSFAEELAVSGNFRSARFLYNPSELVDEEIFVEGTLRKAYVGKTFDDGNEFAVSLRALARSDKRLVWEKDVTRQWKTSANIYGGCGMGIQCSVDKFHAEHNKAMQGIFAEARADLVEALASPSGNPAGEARKEEFVGVGLRVGIAGGVLTVESAIEGAPASKAGVRAGDAILSVDGKSTEGMAVADAVGRIRGVQGTSVTLGVKRAGWNTPRDFTLARDVIREETSAPQAPESTEETIARILKAK
ncbi:MAG: carboxy-terminal processing protease [Deltaproteobacteria bacterium]|nr:carboxy-terminal processing protease [Deltaproteobacteria bacterium]